MKTIGGDSALGACIWHEWSRLVKYSGKLLDIDRLRAIVSKKEMKLVITSNSSEVVSKTGRI